ncbi:hypothetical protein PABG_11766 [Paracoccidioides brasiliensis Pb03]|nr:hypothetical protein PABG_11766 [Paracoccidioides brasiliensis Pb03]
MTGETSWWSASAKKFKEEHWDHNHTAADQLLTKMGVWVFDHSGPYSSGIINVYTDLRQFFQVPVGYTMMSDEELEPDIFISRDEDSSKSITIKEPGNSEEKKIQLSEMLSCQCVIMCHGTTCFLTNDGQVKGIAKFS